MPMPPTRSTSPSAPTSHAEVELKLLIPGLTAAQARQALARAPSLRRRQPQVLGLWNIYFDTPDQFLRSQRSALRLRRTSREGATASRSPWLQTFKTAGQSQGGLSQRGEWERPVRGKTLSLAALADSPWPALDPDGILFTALQPCFETRCERTLWLVRRRSGAVLEVALDAGTIGVRSALGQHQLPMLELELELLQGQPDDLFQLALELAQHLPLLPLDTSKAQRGYALFDAVAAEAITPTQSTPPTPPKPATPVPVPGAALRARTLSLARHQAPAEVAHLVLGEALQQMTGNLALLAQHLCLPPGSAPSSLPAPELVHQARVGWRRWRSLARLLRPWLPGTEDWATARAALSPLLDALAHCRNLDVARSDTVPRWASAYTHSALFADNADRGETAWQQEVVDALQRLDSARQEAYSALGQALQDFGTGASLLAYARWLHTALAEQAGQPGHVPPNAAPAEAPEDRKKARRAPARERGWAEARLQRWHQRLLSQLKAARAPGAHPQQLHDARLLAKRLRYGSEALASLLPKKALRWANDATGWQTRIGLQRDAHQAAQLLLALGASPSLAAFLRGVAAATDISDPGR